MRGRAVFAVAGVAALSVSAFCIELFTPGVLSAQTQTPSAVPEAAGRLALFAAAFDKDEVEAPPERATAMAFLPGRGVVQWDVTGKTPEEAREAEVEAMGLADARAVQREIDEAGAQKKAELAAAPPQGQGLIGGAGDRRAALNVPAITGTAREAGGVLPLNRTAQPGSGLLSLRSGETLRGKPHVYAFAAVSGRTVGLNVLHDDAGWKNGGLTSDHDGFTGQRQAGLAWRKGAVQTSLSYVEQKDHLQILGVQSDKDHRLMLTMAVQPQALLGLFAPPR